jgi:hypothetical protein
MAVVTSNVVGLATYDLRRVYDHSFRRAGFLPQKVTPEALVVAKELVLSLQAEWINAGTPLWTIQYVPLAVIAGSPDVETPRGTVDIITPYWRIIETYRGPCTIGGTTGNATLFGGVPAADVVVPSPNPAVAVNFTTSTRCTSIGILPGGADTFTAALRVNTSDDGGATWTLNQTLASTTFVPGVWSYFDLNPVFDTQYLQIEYFSQTAWTLAALNIGLANSQDIPLGVQNINSYYNLPNKVFTTNRPNTAYIDRRVEKPVIKIWPVPNENAFYQGTVTALLRRYIQDPGEMTQGAEVPARWLEALQWRLAVRIMDEISEEMAYGKAPEMTAVYLQDRQQRYQRVTANAEKSESLAWAEERNKSPLRMTPDVSCYTRG